MNSASIVRENQLNSDRNQKSKLALKKQKQQQKHMKVGQVGWWWSLIQTL